MARQAPLKMYMRIQRASGCEGEKEAKDLKVAIATKNVNPNTAAEEPRSD